MLSKLHALPRILLLLLHFNGPMQLEISYFNIYQTDLYQKILKNG